MEEGARECAPLNAMSAIKDGRVEVEIGGMKLHMLCSLNVVDDIVDKFGELEKLGEAMSGTEAIKNIKWLLARLINEGMEDGREPLTEQQIGKMIHWGSINDLKVMIFDSFRVGISGTTEPPERGEEDEDAEDEKNAEAGKAE